MEKANFNDLVHFLISEITGYVGCVTSQKYNQTRTRQYFTVHLKIQPTQFAKVLISNHRSIKTVRQNFLNAFHDKVPIIVKDIVKGSEVYFFNAYSQVLQQNNPLEFSINDSDAEKIKDLNEEGIVVSVVGKIKFIGETIIQPFEKNGKRRTERLRKGMFSDGSKTIRISVWADLIDVLKEDYLIQLSEVNSRSFNEEICLTTTYATSVCFLTDALDVHFEIPKTIDQPSSTCHCCKSVYSIKIDQYTKCKFCQSRLSMSSGTGIASCVKCGRDFSVKKVSTSSDRIIKALVDFTDENGDLKSVTIFSDVLQKYFPTETFTDDVNLKSSLLELNGVDFLVNPSKNSVEEIRQCKH